MSERLHHHRPLIDLQRINEMLHGFLMMFAPKPVAQPPEDTSIAWEDGEIEDQTEPPGR